METKLSILFYGRTSKTTKDGLLPIYMRVTINGERFEQSTQRYIVKEKWSFDMGRAKGNTEESRTINHFLDTLRQKIYIFQQEIIAEQSCFDMEKFRNKWLGLKEKAYTLLQVFRHNNDQMYKLIGLECSKATHGKYKTTYDHTSAFLKWKYQVNDFEINKLSYSFITDFDFYLKTQPKCNHNTTIKTSPGTDLKALFNLLYRKDWIVYAKAPFGGPHAVIEYLGRYTHIVAISNHRLTAIDEQSVTFVYKDYADDSKQKQMTLNGQEFIRRFEQHILPKRFTRIRTYGYLANRNRHQRINEVLNKMKLPQHKERVIVPVAVHMVEQYGIDLNECPCCKGKTMQLLRIFNPWKHTDDG